MIFEETRLSGVFVISPEFITDDRGFFTRTFCRREFEAHRLDVNFVQCNVSFNKKRGTLRGMHYQERPGEEVKLVRCTRGAIFDVVIDVRPESETFNQWYGVELNADDRRMLYSPKGFAHGFQTLEDNSEVFYQMGEFFDPELARGVRWNDPIFAIEWPIERPTLSGRDRQYSDSSP